MNESKMLTIGITIEILLLLVVSMFILRQLTIVQPALPPMPQYEQDYLSQQLKKRSVENCTIVKTETHYLCRDKQRKLYKIKRPVFISSPKGVRL